MVFNAHFYTVQVLSLNKTNTLTILLFILDNSPFTTIAVMGGGTNRILALLVGCGWLIVKKSNMGEKSFKLVAYRQCHRSQTYYSI